MTNARTNEYATPPPPSPVSRPASCLFGSCLFRRLLLPEQILSEWNSDIGQLLQLVERSCHLINKENMLHKIA